MGDSLKNTNGLVKLNDFNHHVLKTNIATVKVLLTLQWVNLGPFKGRYHTEYENTTSTQI